MYLCFKFIGVLKLFSAAYIRLPEVWRHGEQVPHISWFSRSMLSFTLTLSRKVIIVFCILYLIFIWSLVKHLLKPEQMPLTRNCKNKYSTRLQHTEKLLFHNRRKDIRKDIRRIGFEGKLKGAGNGKGNILVFSRGRAYRRLGDIYSANLSIAGNASLIPDV